MGLRSLGVWSYFDLTFDLIQILAQSTIFKSIDPAALAHWSFAVGPLPLSAPTYIDADFVHERIECKTVEMCGQ